MKNTGIIMVVIVSLLIVVALFLWNSRKQAELATKVKDTSEKSNYQTGLDFFNNIVKLFQDEKEEVNNNNETEEGGELPPYS